MNIYYIDSGRGSDANPGTAALPWKTLAKHDSTTIASGSKVRLQAGAMWNEIFKPKVGVDYRGYGGSPKKFWSESGVPSFVDMPIINGSDRMQGWTPTTGSAGVYQHACTFTAVKVFVDAIYEQTTPLTSVGSAAACLATTASFYMDATNSILYIQLEDSSAPDSHTIEVCGARKYGIWANEVSNVTIEGIAVIRCALSGHIIQGTDSTAANLVIKNCVHFNNGSDALDGGSGGLGGTTGLGGSIMASIIVIPDYVSAAIPGLQVIGCYVGRMDYSHNVVNYSRAGIFLAGCVGAITRGCKVATVNGWAVRLGDWYNSASTPGMRNVLSDLECTNSEGNVAIAGSLYTAIDRYNCHDSYGNGLQLGPSAINGADKADYVTMVDFRIVRIAACYGDNLYNGIDCNYAIGGLLVRGFIQAVEHTCATLEADGNPGASTGWTFRDCIFDASYNTGGAGSAPSDSNRVYPLYIRDTSMTGFLGKNNTVIVHPASPYLKIAATGASDVSHDISLATFAANYPTQWT